MNRDIGRFTYNMLFDEKLDDTVHMAIGMAYKECVGEGQEANESAIHVDMAEESFLGRVYPCQGSVLESCSYPSPSSNFTRTSSAWLPPSTE